MTSALVVGSVAAVAASNGRAVAEAFMNVDVIVLVDTSGSMAMMDSRGGQSRYAVACAELATLQAAQPGRVGIISFSTHCQFCPSGVPHFEGGGTDLAGALRFARAADLEGIRFIVVSDGEPDSERDALAEAEKFRGNIDTVYVGPENGGGREFLRRLAMACHGESVTAAHAQALAPAIERLLLR